MKIATTNWAWQAQTGLKILFVDADYNAEKDEKGTTEEVFEVPDDYELSSGDTVYIEAVNNDVDIKRFLDLLGFKVLVKISALKAENKQFKANFEAAEAMMNQRESITLDSLSMEKYFAMLKLAGILTDDDITRIKRNELQ